MTRAGAGVALLLTLGSAGSAHAESWWTQESIDDDYVPRLRFAPHIGMWAGEFDRTNLGCEDLVTSIPAREGTNTVALPPDQFPREDISTFCFTEDSEEVGLSAGVAAVYRVLGPAHLSVGLDLAFTFPSRDALRGQFIVAVPIAIGVTNDAWSVRPILNATLTPYFSFPDLRRGFAYGGEGGLAVRIAGLAELQMIGGYHASSDWQMGIIRIAGYLP